MVAPFRRFARSYHFASPAYHAAFSPRVAVDTAPIRAAALAAHGRLVAETSPSGGPASWHASPMVSLLGGKRLEGGERVLTVDAFGATNGAQLLASTDEMEALLRQIEGPAAPRADLRPAIRRLEARLLEQRAGEMIAAQLVDFGKQDGVTEFEEAHQANPVEMRLNDDMWEAEAAGEIVIPRRPVLVPCVSNFSHFLDLCRKTLRCLELGVPVVVLSRSHTAQYPFRWAQLLADELAAARVDPTLFTFVSASLPNQQRLIRAATRAAASEPAAAAEGTPTPFLFTGARSLAALIKADVAPGMIASTQGPNLMVALGLPPSVAKAAALSATIENSGQCTALRVLLAPQAEATDAAVGAMLAVDAAATGADAASYLSAGQFAGLLAPAPVAEDGRPPRTPSGYTAHAASEGVSYRVSVGLPDDGLSRLEPLAEHWRQVVLDVATPPAGVDIASDESADAVGAWLVRHQPITCSVNGAVGRDAAPAVAAGAPPDHFRFARRVFERSALCVYSVGDADAPVLSAQARPQDGECFGELPPLSSMADVTVFPMVVPSAQAAYFSHYSTEHLRALGAAAAAPPPPAASPSAAPSSGEAAKRAAAVVDAFVSAAGAAEARGYVRQIGAYLLTAADGPRRAFGQRTALYGLQRPPMDGRRTALRVGPAATSLDELLPLALPFAMTNARGQAVVSFDPSQQQLKAEWAKLVGGVAGLEQLEQLEQTEEEFAAERVQASLHRTVRVEAPYTGRGELLGAGAAGGGPRFPLAQQFCTKLVTLGHIKSSRPDDAAFVDYFGASPKWLRAGVFD